VDRILSPRHSSAAGPEQDQRRYELDKLLSEVNALALRLKQTARRAYPDDDLSAAGLKFLEILQRCGDLTVPQMARLDSTSRQNIQIVVNRLKQEGCLVRVPNPAHKRSELVRLTERGVATLQSACKDAEAYKEKLLPRLSEADLARASDLLRSIREQLSGTTSAPAEPEETSNPAPRIHSKPQPKDASRPPQPVEQPSYDENELPVSLL